MVLLTLEALEGALAAGPTDERSYCVPCMIGTRGTADGKGKKSLLLRAWRRASTFFEGVEESSVRQEAGEYCKLEGRVALLSVSMHGKWHGKEHDETERRLLFGSKKFL